MWVGGLTSSLIPEETRAPGGRVGAVSLEFPAGAEAQAPAPQRHCPDGPLPEPALFPVVSKVRQLPLRWPT